MGYDGLRWGDTPLFGDPLMGWPIYGKVGMSYLDNEDPVSPPSFMPQLRREDDEIIIILSSILKEL